MRIKEVKENKHPGSIDKVEKLESDLMQKELQSSYQTIQQNNLNKLEEMDFDINNETKEFSELRKNLQSMTRKLSLTSGISSKGSHIKVDENTIKKMNCTDDIHNCIKTNVLPNTPSCKHKRSTNTHVLGDENPNLEFYNMISTLNESDRKCLIEFIIKSVVFQTDRKMTELSNLLLDYNIELLNKARHIHTDGT